MIENTNTKQFYPGPILNNTLEITDFLFNDAEQIKVKHSKFNEENILVDVDLNYGTDYEVTKVLSSDINVAEAALTASTGQITLKNVNVLAGEKLTVYRVSQIIQDKDYPRTGAFPAATHEGALDYLTMQNQEQQEELSRALKVPISTGEFNAAVPVPLSNRILRIDENATGFEFVPYDLDERLDTFEDTIEKTLETNKTELEGIIEDNKQEVLSIQSDYQEEMDNKFQMVSDAADKINELESAVDTATTAADNAATAADNATEQAAIATQKVQEIIDFNPAKVDLSNLTEEGLKVIKDNSSSGFNLFDTKISDHILEGNEAKGWALQGTYVSGDLYPDFYNRCLSEYQDENNTQKVIRSNVTITGALINANGVLSGFANSVYASLPNAWISENYDTWEMVFDVTTGDDVTTQQFVYSNFYNSSGVYSGVNIEIHGGKFALALRDNSSTSPTINGTYTVLTNTNYLIRAKFTGIAYTLEYSTNNGASWEIDINYSSTTKVTTRSEGYFTVGNLYLQLHNDYKNPWLGTINLKNSYINANGSRWWTGADTVTQNPNKHLFYPISIKSTIDDIYNQYGVADFYGIDEENERVFLPRNKYFQQLTVDVSKVNEMMEAGLPNIKGGFGTGITGTFNNVAISQTSGAFYGNSTTGAGNSTWVSGNCSSSVYFDASKSNAIYGNSDTAQPPSSLKLLYYCVGNTVVNDAEIDAGGLVVQMEQKANIFLDNTMPTEEFANNIVDLSRINAYITESYKSGNSWYRVWSDGWIEQGGRATVTDVSFLKKYTSTPNVVLMIESKSGYRTVTNISINGFTVGDGGAAAAYPVQWLSEGK